MHKRKRTSFGSRDLNQLFITIFFCCVDDLRGFSFVFTLIKGSLASYLKVSHPLKTTVMASSCAIAFLSIVFSSNIFFFLFVKSLTVDSGCCVFLVLPSLKPLAARSTEFRHASTRRVCRDRAQVCEELETSRLRRNKRSHRLPHWRELPQTSAFRLV